MNLYHLDSGEIRFFARKAAARKAAQEEADKIGLPVNISRMFIGIDRDNIARMANKELGFYRFVGRVGTVAPHKRPKPKLKMRKLAAMASLLVALALPNPSEATSCTTRKSGSVTIETCTYKTSTTQCRSYKSGSVTKKYCR